MRNQFTKESTLDHAALEEFQTRFNSEEACADYLFAEKWPHGFSCPRCAHTQSSRINTRRLPLYQCVRCHYQASLTVDTIMEGSSTDLLKWFTAMFLVSSTHSGVNALRLSQLIEVTYKTAWLMLRKIRQSITQANDAIKLTGTVYIDAGRCGKSFTSAMYSESHEFPVLVGTAADTQDQPVYVKIQMIPEVHYDDFRLRPEGISAFRDIHTDTSAAVTCTMGTRTKRNVMKGYPIFKEARAWMKRMYHGLSRMHQQHYWNEFCWRFNTKLSNHPLFESMLRLCAATPTATYAELLRQG